MSRWKKLAYRTLATVLRRSGDMDNSVVFFMFHGIHADMSNALISASSRSASALRQGLVAIRKKYRILSIDEAVTLLESAEPIPENAVVITFDDSLRCLTEIAAPVLAELGVHATFYVSTDVLDKGLHYWWHRLEYATHYATGLGCSVLIGDRRFEIAARQADLAQLKAALRACRADEQEAAISHIEQELGACLASGDHPYPCAEPMRWEDAAKLARMGMTIGSHSVTHSNMTLLSTEKLEAELLLSRRIIQGKLGVSCDHFCYPYGIFNPEARNAAKRAGYRSAVIVGKGGQGRIYSDPYMLPRLSMDLQAWKVPYQVSGQDDAVMRMRHLVKI